ncbi:MAG TPA: glycoside hydrolase family 172 protein [Opitutaceae bacterium]|nr:glycoside hydrolase family 172 protein [Opitutaceae bacterium]
MSSFGSSLIAPLTGLSRILNVDTRSITPENPTGAKGGGAQADPVGADHPARELGRGWKCRPYIVIKSGETAELASIDGPGALQHIWMTPTSVWRDLILRFYWDDQTHPSVECPVGDFFACGWGNRENFNPVVSAAVCVNPGSAFNCYWEMPFQRRCRITMENRGVADSVLFYQIDYALGAVPDNSGYFHAQFRRVNPLPEMQPYTILDGVRGAGHYVGTTMCWGVNNDGWWGEGEVKFFLDGDAPDAPTICGTGTEDYFCGSFNFENKREKRYQEFNTPYAGMPHVLRPDGLYRSQQRFGLYRWHLLDPIRFAKDIRVTCQALGWRSERRFLPLRDDIASVAFWYQQLPTIPFPPLPTRDALEIV